MRRGSAERLRRQGAALRRLLNALATGGREPIISLEDWEEHLGRQPSLLKTPVGRWFRAALRGEWQPAEPPTALCAFLTDEIEATVRAQPGPWATVWGHILRVAGYAVRLAGESGVDPQAAYLAALFHDACKLEEWDAGRPHAELGAELAVRTLGGELPAETLRAVRDAILIPPARPPLSWGIARVLHDADKLDKIGATGLIRRVSKAGDIEEACEGAERSVAEADAFPLPALLATDEFLRPKLAFALTLEKRLDEACDLP